VDLDEVLAATFSPVAPHLTERQRRLLLGAAARALGYGGVSRVARLADASRPTVRWEANQLTATIGLTVIPMPCVHDTPLPWASCPWPASRCSLRAGWWPPCGRCRRT
jgi:hypothetical protein